MSLRVRIITVSGIVFIISAFGLGHIDIYSIPAILAEQKDICSLL